MGYFLRSVDELRELAAKGDARAQEWLIERFKDDNLDLPLVAGVLIRFDAPDGHLLMSLIIPEGATLEAIRDNWYIIAEWRRRLTQWQGRWKGRHLWSSKARLLDYLASMQSVMSYKEMADWVNHVVVNLLEYHVEAQGESVSEVEALLILLWLGMRDEEARQWCSAITQNIQAEKAPFLPDGGPVDQMRVREQLRYWRKTRGGEK